MTTPPSKGPPRNGPEIPILIGVTGHRHIRPDQLEPLKAELRRWMTELAQTLAHTPLVLLTPLAEGADILAAEMALECGWSLHIALPAPPEEYARSSSFDRSEEQRARMLELVQQHGAHVIPSLRPQASAEGFDARYLDQLTYIASHAHALLAIWDGHAAQGPAGTGDVVLASRWASSILAGIDAKAQARAEGIPIPASASAAIDKLESLFADRFELIESIERTPALPVFWFPVARDQSTAQAPNSHAPRLLPPIHCSIRETPAAVLQAAPEEPGDVAALQGRRSLTNPTGAPAHAFFQGWQRLDAVNRNLKARWPAPGAQPPDIGQLRFQVVDALCTRPAALADTYFYLRIAATALGLLLLELASWHTVGSVWETATALVLIGVAWVTTPLNLAKSTKHSQYRALAEHLRVRKQFPASRLYTTESLELVEQMHLIGPENDWVSHSIDVINLLESPDGGPTPEALDEQPPACEALDFAAAQQWIDDQIHYFKSAISRELGKADAWRRVSASGSICALLLSAGFCVAVTRSATSDASLSWLATAAAAGLIVAAIGRAVTAYKAYHSVANRYKVALRRFRMTRRRIEELRRRPNGDHPAATAAIRLARLAMRENSEWFSLRLEHPPDSHV